MPRSVSGMHGFTIHATDGDMSTVDECLFDNIWSWMRTPGGRASMYWYRHSGSNRCIGPSRAL
jgi:hypothetical protein